MLFLLQLTLTKYGQVSGTLPDFSIVVFLMVYFVGLIALLFVLWHFIRRSLRQRRRLPKQFRMQTLLVKVPRAGIDDENKENLESNKEKIAVAESLYAVLGGLKPQRGFNAWLYGRHDHIGFEMVVINSLIHFYVAVPTYLRQLFEDQLHAQYPDAHVEVVKDYNIFKPNSFSIGTYLVLERPAAFPIKTYEEMESDPMNAITNSLSKVKTNDGVAIQFLVRSAKRIWRNRGIHIAREMQQGKRLSEIDRSWLNKLITWPIDAMVYIFKTTNSNQSQPDMKEKYQLSPMENKMVEHLEKKASKAGFDVNIRVVVSSYNQSQTNAYINDILQAFSQYSIYQYGNRFKIAASFSKNKFFNHFIHRDFNEGKKLILNTEEFASVYHLPLPTTETPNILWLSARKAAPPVDMPAEGLLLGMATFRGEEKPVRIADEDRRRHTYIIGRSGSGKSVLLEQMAIQDIIAGHGVCVVDPHGDLIDHILANIPKNRAEDVIIFNPADVERPVGLNMLEAKTSEEMDFAAQEMVSIFYKLVPNPEMIGPMFEHYMRNAMLTLMANQEHPGTIADIPRMFTDKSFQDHNLQYVTDPMVKAFWQKEMTQTSNEQRGEMLGYLISKVGRFVENEMVRNIIGQSKSGFNIRQVMDEKKILLVNLAKGTVGEVNSNLLGLVIVSKLQMAALGRANLPEDQRNDFYLYIDEFQNFITDSIATILSEARKYRLNLIIAHQYMAQLVKNNDSSIRDAIMGNIGTMIAYRIGVEDAEVLAKEFAPVFTQNDLLNIEKYTAYIKLLIHNTASRPFNMNPLGPLPEGHPELAQSIRELSRLKYGRPRAEVTREILERTHLGEPTPVQKPPIEPSL